MSDTSEQTHRTQKYLVIYRGSQGIAQCNYKPRSDAFPNASGIIEVLFEDGKVVGARVAEFRDE